MFLFVSSLALHSYTSQVFGVFAFPFGLLSVNRSPAPMHGFDQPQVEWQDSPSDILLKLTVEALSNTLVFFDELLYKQPVEFQGIKTPLHVINFGAMRYQREDQAKRIILCLL